MFGPAGARLAEARAHIMQYSLGVLQAGGARTNRGAVEEDFRSTGEGLPTAGEKSVTVIHPRDQGAQQALRE